MVSRVWPFDATAISITHSAAVSIVLAGSFPHSDHRHV
jgi:hypothetical protein